MSNLTRQDRIDLKTLLADPRPETLKLERRRELARVLTPKHEKRK